MTKKKPTTRHATDGQLADEVIKALYNLPTAKEAHDQAERHYYSAWRDKTRVVLCHPDNCCEAPACPYCQRRR